MIIGVVAVSQCLTGCALYFLVIVASLKLGTNSLVGTIPTEIGLMKRLAKCRL